MSGPIDGRGGHVPPTRASRQTSRAFGAARAPVVNANRCNAPYTSDVIGGRRGERTAQRRRHAADGARRRAHGVQRLAPRPRTEEPCSCASTVRARCAGCFCILRNDSSSPRASMTASTSALPSSADELLLEIAVTDEHLGVGASFEGAPEVALLPCVAQPDKADAVESEAPDVRGNAGGAAHRHDRHTVGGEVAGCLAARASSAAQSLAPRRGSPCAACADRTRRVHLDGRRRGTARGRQACWHVPRRGVIGCSRVTTSLRGSCWSRHPRFAVTTSRRSSRPTAQPWRRAARAGAHPGDHPAAPSRTAARVLDVGGGAGVHAAWLADDGHSVHVIDPMPSHVEQANRLAGPRRRITAEVGDARRLAVTDGTVDAVLLLGPL